MTRITVNGIDVEYELDGPQTRQWSLSATPWPPISACGSHRWPP